MHYFLRPTDALGKAVPVLQWLLQLDNTPNVLPIFPSEENSGLVVAYLLSGEVYAEVLPHPQAVIKTCGEGVPMGRLYFQIPRDRLYMACPPLSPDVFGGMR
jgi:hypothetical protein